MQPKIKIILTSLIISILLMMVKFVAYFITQSNAILTDAAESIVNVVASGFAFYSIYLSALPKDENHPYGHGKVEFFSAFVEGTLIILAGIIIIGKSIYNLFYPVYIEQIDIGAILIGITGLINGLLAWYLKLKGKQFNSLTLIADGKHLMSDAISSIGLILGLIIIYQTKIYQLDAIISILIAFYIIYNGYKLTRKSVGGLMDESDLQVVNKIIDSLNANRRPEWIDVHNLRTQSYGAETHIDCHLTLPYYFDLNQVHQQVTDIDRLLNGSLDSENEFFIHADPCVPQCCHYCTMPACPVRKQEKTKNIVWTLDNITKNQKHFDT